MENTSFFFFIKLYQTFSKITQIYAKKVLLNATLKLKTIA